MAPGVETPNELMVVFSNTVSAGFASLQGPVNGVFGLMIALVVALTGIQWALSPNRDLLAAGFGKVLLIGFFAWLINDWQRLSETLYAGFIELGLTAGGGGLAREDFLNPGAILAQGWSIVKALGETPAPVENPFDVVGNLVDALILSLAMIGIMLAFAVLALQIIVALLEFKIVTLGGFVLLPFGIWSKSAFLAERPLGYVVSAGLKVLALAIVVSGAQSVFDQLQPTANPDIYEALAILVAAILLAMLAVFIPNLASALVTGGPALGAGTLAAGGLAVGGASLLAGAGLVGAGAIASGGAARMAGPTRAAAGAGGGRSPPPAAPPPQPPSGSGPGPGRAPDTGSGQDGGASSQPPSSKRPSLQLVEEPAVAWSPSSEGQGTSGEAPSPKRSDAAMARDRRSAEAAFHRAAAQTDEPGGERKASGRRAALRAFFIANAGRGLLPAGETSGTLSPRLRTED